MVSAELVKLTLVRISMLADLAVGEMRLALGLVVQIMRSEGGMRLCWRMEARTREPRWPVGEVRMNLVMVWVGGEAVLHGVVL